METPNPGIAEQQLAEVSKLLNHISDSSPGAIYQFKMDTEGKYSFTYLSNGFENLTGISRERILNDPTVVFQNVEPEDYQRFSDSIIESATNMTQWNHKFRLIRHDLGKTIWIKGVSNPEKNDDGSILWNGIIIDVTESEELNEKFIESNKRYQYATKATNDVIWDWDLITDRIHWSDGFEIVFGTELTEDKLNIHFWEECIHPDDKERVSISIHKSILNKEENRWEENYRLVKPDGSFAYINDRGYIIHNKYGRPIRMVGAMKDITDIQITAMERQRLMDDLTRRNAALEQFTYIVSHNLRAPVANLLGLSEAIMDESIDEEVKEIMTKQLSQAATNLDTVLKDLNYILDTSKDTNLKKNLVSFDEVFNKIKNEMKEQIEKENVQFITNFEKAPHIKIVPNYMHIILSNLISNGIRFRSEREPEIKITTWKDDKFIHLDYEDNGIGVDLDKFGYKFYDLYHTFHPHIKGKGVGVFLIKTIMDNINGEIAVSSKVNNGTKFFLKFNNSL